MSSKIERESGREGVEGERKERRGERGNMMGARGVREYLSSTFLTQGLDSGFQ